MPAPVMRERFHRWVAAIGSGPLATSRLPGCDSSDVIFAAPRGPDGRGGQTIARGASAAGSTLRHCVFRPGRQRDPSAPSAPFPRAERWFPGAISEEEHGTSQWSKTGDGRNPSLRW
jgi:hypothetical protein